MTGATSPRLHLELMVARSLIPAADDSNRGALARVERLERRIGVDGQVAVDAPVRDAAAGRTDSASGAGAPSGKRPDSPAAAAPPPARPVVATAPAASTAPGAAAVAPGAAASTASAAAKQVGPITLQQVKDAWPEVLEAVKAAKLSAWLVVFTARVSELRENDVLVMSFPSESDVASFKQQLAPGQGVSDYLRAAIVSVLGIRVKFVARGDAEAPAGPAENAASSNASPSNATPSNATSSNATPSNTAPAEQPSASQASASSAPVDGSATVGSPAVGSAVGATGWATVAIPGSAAVSYTHLR